MLRRIAMLLAGLGIALLGVAAAGFVVNPANAWDDKEGKTETEVKTDTVVVTETAPPVTVTTPAVTLPGETVVQSGGTEVVTVTQPAVTVVETQPAVTVTTPAITETVTETETIEHTNTETVENTVTEAVTVESNGDGPTDKGALPFTGLPLWVFVLIGGLLTMAGAAVLMRTRRP